VKFDAKYKPELAASDDQTRPHLANVYLDAKNKRLVGTNGHVLVSVPVQSDGGEVSADHPDDTSGFVSKEALKAARESGDGIVRANSHLYTSDDRSFPRPDGDGCTFPPYAKVIPEKEDSDIVIGVSAKYLVEIAKALGYGSAKSKNMGLKLRIKPSDLLGPITVTVATEDDDGAVAIIMPMRI